MSIDEMLDELRAMISDRNTPARQRQALEMAMRLALRGRHITSQRLPAVTSSVQDFVKAREILDDARTRLNSGIDRISGASDPSLDPPDDE